MHGIFNGLEKQTFLILRSLTLKLNLQAISLRLGDANTIRSTSKSATARLRGSRRRAAAPAGRCRRRAAAGGAEERWAGRCEPLRRRRWASPYSVGEVLLSEPAEPPNPALVKPAAARLVRQQHHKDLDVHYGGGPGGGPAMKNRSSEKSCAGPAFPRRHAALGAYPAYHHHDHSRTGEIPLPLCCRRRPRHHLRPSSDRRPLVKCTMYRNRHCQAEGIEWLRSGSPSPDPSL